MRRPVHFRPRALQTRPVTDFWSSLSETVLPRLRVGPASLNMQPPGSHGDLEESIFRHPRAGGGSRGIIHMDSRFRGLDELLQLPTDPSL